MTIKQRLNLGFFIVSLLVGIAGLLGIILSSQVSGLRNIELPMEQNLREVEVSIWETIHAADAFRATGFPYYEELYHKQIADVNGFFPKYEALTDTDEERAYIREFSALWDEAKAAGDKMISLIKAQEEQSRLFYKETDGADKVIDSDIQAKWSPDDPHLLAKERAVREVEVSIWEAINAANQYDGVSEEERWTENILEERRKITDFKKLMIKKFADVNEFWLKYKALATTKQEKEAIIRFEGLWEKAVGAGNDMLRLHDEADKQFDLLYEKIDKADDVLDYKMQAYIQKRIEKEDLLAGRIRKITLTVVIFSFSFAIVISVLISRSIARPIGKLRDAAIEIGKGRLDAVVEIETMDEIGDLAKSFNSMAALRKRAEEEIRENEIRYKSLFERESSAVMIFDGETLQFEDANQRTLSLFGYTKEEFLNLKVFDISAEKEKTAVSVQKVKDEAPDSRYVPLRYFVKKDGSVFPGEIFPGVFMFKGRKKITEVINDITERKNAEDKLKRVYEELHDFAYIVSHDLKAPLRAIGAITSWLAEDYKDKFDDAGKEHLHLLLNRTRRMHNMIEGILHYSRAGRVRGDPVLIETEKVVKQTIESIILPENIRIIIHEPLPAVTADPFKISQVFQNLLSNAVKYMDKPEGLIEVGAKNAGDFWEFFVKDNGPGIEEKHFERIFQIFQTLKPKDEFESTGIGLSIVKKIIEQGGGRIWVESEVGKGSAFRFTLTKKL